MILLWEVTATFREVKDEVMGKLRGGTVQSFLQVKTQPCCVFKSMQSKVTRESGNIESLGAESLTLLDRCVFVFVSGRLCL